MQNPSSNEPRLDLMLPWRRKSIVLRDLTPDDAPALAALHAQAFYRGWAVDEFEQLISSTTSVGQGARFSEHGALCGFVLSRLAGGEAEVLSIAVHQARRRMGIARVLLDHHLARLRQMRARELFLEVDEQNFAALAFYRNFHFSVVGRRNAYYSDASGGHSAALTLRCDLEA